MFGKGVYLAASAPRFVKRFRHDRIRARLDRQARRLGVRPIAGGQPALATKPRPAGNGQAAPAAPAAVIPFVRASHEHIEGAFLDRSNTPGAAALQLGPDDIPAYGFMRNVVLVFTFSGGVLGAGVLAADFPWNVLDEVAIYDTNGAPMFGPFPSYSLYAAHTFGGYQWNARPEDHPDFVGTINASFMLRVPIEITAWDGLGSLANQSASAPYKIRMTLAASTTLFSTAPTTIPAVQIRGYLEAWSPPSERDVFQNPQATFPPNHGTVQFWSRWVPIVAAGARTIKLERVGNMIRNVIFITRDSAGARVTAHWPDPVSINWDARQLIVNEPRFYRRGVMRERYGFNPPAGVIVYDFTHDQDGHPGNENRHLYLPTVQASRLEIAGTFGTGASSLEILTNDIVPAGAPQTPVGGPVGGRG